MTRNELKGCLHFFCYYKYEPKWGQSTEADQDNFRICWMHSWRTHCRTATATPFPTKSEGRKSSLLWNHIYKSTVLWPASSWKITLGVKELFFIHWTGKSVRDVLFFYSEESHCLPGLILSYKMVFLWGEMRSVIAALQHNLPEQEGVCEKQILFSVLYQKRSPKSLYLQLYKFCL